MISENVMRVLQARYLRRDTLGQIIETPEQLLARVARAVAEAELFHGTAADARFWEERFHGMMTSLDFLPYSPTLINAGTPLGQLSACFVLPIEDNMESIFGTLRDAALIQRTGGGTGFSFSRLRPQGDPVTPTGGSSFGPVSFMKIYDCATENIKLGGRRRGANMGVLRVDHPDIEEFIRAKLDGVSFRNFNISVGATDEFMAAVESGGELALRHQADGHVIRSLAARGLFDEICKAAG
jgi:ribonucleoside-diphosphate reductase alpha chain